MSTKKTHYQVLGIPPTATAEEIRYQYLSLARAGHPDKQILHADMSIDFSAVTAAYTVLKDKEKRRLYDIELQLFGPKPCTRCKGKGTVTEMKGWASKKVKCAECEGSGRK